MKPLYNHMLMGELDSCEANISIILSIVKYVYLIVTF